MTRSPAIIRQRADAARRLLDDPTLQEVIREIREEAVAAFLASGGNPESLMAAHRKIEAIQPILDALETRLSDAVVLDKSEQRRGTHD